MEITLNLNIEESTAKAVQAYAQKKKVSVSNLVEDYFEKLTTNQPKKTGGKSFVDKYAGIASGKMDKNLTKAKEYYLRSKYGN